MNDTKQVAPKLKFDVVGARPTRPDGVEKVTGKARYGADLPLAGLLVGRILRSPHAHARICSIDTSKAAAMVGVKAVVTRDDFPALEQDFEVAMQSMMDTQYNVMARDKALYEGHAVAAVAAISTRIAKQALAAIEVDYEVLAHVTDVDQAMAANAPLLHGERFSNSVDGTTGKASNIASVAEVARGDLTVGFAEADFIVEREFKTEASHQGYIEPHACVANIGADGRGDLWVCTQGHYDIRNMCAGLLGMEVSNLRVSASEIGGGFGGKTTVFMEPVACMLSRKSGQPVKIVMSREEVFKASGPTSSSSMWAKMGVTKDGRMVAGEAVLKFQAGAFPGSPVGGASRSAFACYTIPHAKVTGYDVVLNRPKVTAYRAPGAPISAFAIESLVDELAEKIGMDPIELRLKNAVTEGVSAVYGPTFGPIGYAQTLQAAKAHPHYKIPLKANQGRGIASGFWFNYGGETCVSLNLNVDGTVALAIGTPDIGGTRASMCQMAAEALGVEYERVQTIIADTTSLGYNEATGGSRVAFSAGLATIQAAHDLTGKLCERAAQMWGIPVDAVTWEDGYAKPAGSNAGEFEPISLVEFAKQAASTGGPVAGHSESNLEGAGVSFGTHLADVEVDPDTGSVSVLRYTVVQDAGKAIHPSYVEGQYQGGAVQGIGWALNEEYIYGDDGRLQNAGFLDYRMPVASDLPMIDAVIVEVPNPGHPYGVRGVGETPIVPPLAAIGNAVSQAAGVRMTDVPISPPKILKALSESQTG